MGWGLQPERLRATVYIMFYTIASALPFLGVVLYRGVVLFEGQWGTVGNRNTSTLMGFVLTLPLLIKTPIFLLHLWLPKAHVEAPVYGSIVLAGVLLKIGGAGVIRLLPLINTKVGAGLGLVSITGGLIAAIVTIAQVDIKALIAYSRVVHISTTSTCLLVSLTPIPQLVWLILLGHGVCSSGLFYLATVRYSRVNTRRLVVSQGLLLIMPRLGLVWALLILINLRAPPSITLLSEITMRYNIFILHPLRLFIRGRVIVLVLIYRLQLYYNC